MTQPAVTIFSQQIMWMMQPDVIIFNQRHDWGKLAVTLFNQQIWEMQPDVSIFNWQTCDRRNDVLLFLTNRHMRDATQRLYSAERQPVYCCV